MRRFTFLLPLAAALSLAATDAGAGASTIAVGEITPPPPSFGVDRATLKRAAEGEIEKIDARRLPARRVVMSIAVRGSDSPVGCTINAMLRDGRTGSMIAIMEASASAESGTPADADLKKAVVATAVRSVVRQIPTALGEKK